MKGATWLGWCAALPGLVLAATITATLAGVMPPLEAGPPLNLTEVSAIGAHAEMMRLVRQGVDPNQRMAVRPDIFGRSVPALTPLEAATAARRVEALALLVDLGAVIHQQNFAVLSCLAEGGGEPAVTAFVESRRPAALAAAPPDCSKILARQ